MTKLDRKFDPAPVTCSFVNNSVKSFKGRDSLTNKSADHCSNMRLFFIQSHTNKA